MFQCEGAGNWGVDLLLAPPRDSVSRFANRRYDMTLRYCNEAATHFPRPWCGSSPLFELDGRCSAGLSTTGARHKQTRPSSVTSPLGKTIREDRVVRRASRHVDRTERSTLASRCFLSHVASQVPAAPFPILPCRSIVIISWRSDLPISSH
jgi:hypothetical protein